MELNDFLDQLRDVLSPLEYAAVMAKYFGEGKEDWIKLQMVGGDVAVVGGNDLIEYLSEQGLSKFRKKIWRENE